MDYKLPVSVSSEIGRLQGVILHTPGVEVESMTPTEASRALYSDILNLDIARKEYAQLSGVLAKVTPIFYVKDLLQKVLENPQGKEQLINGVCRHEGVEHLENQLRSIPPHQLANILIEGLPHQFDSLANQSLTAFLCKDRYALPPLYNFYFTRDASMSINGNVLIGKMANGVRDRETMIMEAIFNDSGVFETETINPSKKHWNSKISIEGGDVLMAREDILLVGNSSRTTTQAIDFMVEELTGSSNSKIKHIIVQELPRSPESFIHLDMVFTLLDVNSCMVYSPLILKPTQYRTIHITVSNGKVLQIRQVEGILPALKELGMDLNPIICGGTDDPWNQEREQWHSGANFFSIAPGKVIGYARNKHTLEEMTKHQFAILKANDVISGKVNIDEYKRCAITLEGSELARGGGGARCMTMPVSRENVQW